MVVYKPYNPYDDNYDLGNSVVGEGKSSFKGLKGLNLHAGLNGQSSGVGKLGVDWGDWGGVFQQVVTDFSKAGADVLRANAGIYPAGTAIQRPGMSIYTAPAGATGVVGGFGGVGNFNVTGLIPLALIGIVGIVVVKAFTK